MPYPIKKALRRKNIKSNDVLAQKLLDLETDDFLDKKGAKLSKRTLGTKIGELDRGMTSWWRNRPNATKHLLEALGLAQDDLDLSPSGGRHQLSFASFPAFPALTLPREMPWRVAEAHRDHDGSATSRYGVKPTLDFWLAGKRRGIPPDRVQWLCVRDEVEFELLTRWLAAINSHPVLRVASPDVVVSRHIDEMAWSDAQIVVVEDVGSAELVGRLASMRNDAPLLIIARGSLPAFESRTENGKVSLARAAHASIECWTWTFLPDWRQLLVRSVEQRMLDLDVDNQFSSGATLDLLDKFDRGHQWFVDVNDVLVLCQAVCEGAEADLGEKLDNTSDTAALLSLLFNRDQAHLGNMQKLVQARWRGWALNWSAALSREVWIGLLKTEERFETMVHSRLLEQQGHGYGFERPVVTRLLLRSYLVERMSKADLDSWALACFDDERRLLVDAALDALTLEALHQLARKIGPACADRQYLGAAEAVFAAFGRRMVYEEINGPLLREFAGHIIPKLRTFEDRVLPLSRSLHAPADDVAWTTVCWAWSVRVQPHPQETWQFPRSGAALGKLPRWLDAYGSRYSAYSWERIGPQLRDFLTIVRVWFASRVRNVDQAMPLRLFRMALLADIDAHKGDVEPSWWDGIIGDAWAEQALLECGTQQGKRAWHVVALQWWRSLVRHRQQASQGPFGTSPMLTWHPTANGHSTLLIQVVDCLSAHASAAVNLLSQDEWVFLANHAVGLPASLHRELLKRIAQEKSAHWYDWEIEGLMAQFGPEVADALPALLDHPKFGPTAARRLWAYLPGTAEGLLRAYRGQRSDGIRHLILASPPTTIGAVLKVWERDPSLLDWGGWRGWALAHLSNAREHAPALFKLIEAPPLTLAK